MLAVGPVDGEIQGWKVEFTLFTKYSTNFLCPDIIHTQTHLDIHTQTHLDTHTHKNIVHEQEKVAGQSQMVAGRFVFHVVKDRNGNVSRRELFLKMSAN